MRINFILPEAGLAGGVRVAAVYAERLARRGHRVAVISIPRPRPTPRQRARALLRHGRWLVSHPQHSHLDGLNVDHRVIDRQRPIRDQDVPDADVTIATWWETAEWVWNLGKSKGRKIYFCQHDETHLDSRSRRVDATYSLQMPQVCVSTWVADEIRARHPHARQVVIPNAVDPELFRSQSRHKGRPLTIGFMYSTLPSKGSDLAMNAISRARRQGLEFKVLSFGHAPPPTGTMAADDRFELQPAQLRIADIYRACDAWLFTSHVEGFGLPILEAMACGTPVIATPAGAAPHLLAGDGGILVDSADATALSDGICRLHQFSDARWQAMSDSARATANSYTWNDATDRFEEMLRMASATTTTRPHMLPVSSCEIASV